MNSLMSKLTVPLRYYRTRKSIPCECPKCKCPAAGGRIYTFQYVRGSLVYFDVPKCASTTIRRRVYGKDEKASLRPALLPRSRQYRFSFIRNPWDRAVSNWKMFTTQPFRINQLNSMGGAADMEFSDFLDFSKKNINHHWLPQSRYVPRDIDFIGRLEFFDRDFDVVKTVLTRSGLALLSEGTEQMNRTERDHYKAYYNGKTKALVEDMYREDIERFEYEF